MNIRIVGMALALLLISGCVADKRDLSEMSQEVMATQDIHTAPELGIAVSGDALLAVDNDDAAGSRLSRIVFDGNVANYLTGIGTWVAPAGTGDIKADGTIPLTANWDVGTYTITGTRFISDIAIGTSPLAVTSTTVVTNLNADLLDGESASAFEDADAAITKSDEAASISGAWEWLDNTDIVFGTTGDWFLSYVTSSNRLELAHPGNTYGDIYFDLHDNGGDTEFIIINSDVTAKANLNLEGDFILGAITIDETELGYLDGVTSDIQTQFDLKAPIASPNLTGTLFIAEQADAAADVAGSGQIWVNLATPNELWFTDDAGTDVRLGSGSMTWPTVAGIPYWTSGTAWGGAYTLVTTIGDPGSDTSISSEQAVREAFSSIAFNMGGAESNLLWDTGTNYTDYLKALTLILTNKTIDGDDNTLQDVPVSSLTDLYAYQEIPVGWMQDGTSGPDALDDGLTRSPYAYRDFDSSADEDLNFVWIVPADLSGTTIQFRVYYLITNATGPSATEGVAFGLSGVSLGDNDASNGTKGTVVVVTDDTLNAAQHDIMITGWSGDVTVTNLAAGEVAEMAIIRDVSDTVDDYAQDVGVFMIQIRYVQNPAR